MGKEYEQIFHRKEFKWILNLRGCLTSFILRGIIKTPQATILPICFPISIFNEIMLFLQFNFQLNNQRYKSYDSVGKHGGTGSSIHCW